MITRRGTESSAFVEVGGGSFGRGEVAAGATRVIRAVLIFQAALNTRRPTIMISAGWRYLPQHTGMDSQVGISLNGGYTFSDKHRLGLTFTGFDVNGSGSPGYFTMNDLDDYNDKSNYSLDAQYTGASDSGTYQWMARYFIGRDENKFVAPIASNPDGWDTGIPSENITDQDGGSGSGYWNVMVVIR